MPTNSLTDHKCRSAKAEAKPAKLFDGNGLFLHVMPSGVKTWRMAYRLHGKPQTATFGPYPLVTLAEARAKRDDIRKKLIEGVSPKSVTRGGMTLTQATNAFWEGRNDVTPAYRNNALRGIEMHLSKELGDVPLSAITRDSLLECLNKMDKAGKHVYVRTVRMWVAQVFDWGIEQGYCKENPAKAIRPEKAFGKRAEVSHAALSLSDVPAFLARLSIERELQSVLACRLLALTWVRTGELRVMQWSEIDGDTWRIPAGKMKRRLDLMVPLSRQALEILQKLKERDRGSRFVFPAEHTIDRPMSENAVLYLLHRMGYKGLMTGHGWRSIGSTWANEAGYNPDAIERQLAHVPDDKIRGVYNRAEYLPERRQMLSAWADWLDQANSSGVKC